MTKMRWPFVVVTTGSLAVAVALLLSIPALIRSVVAGKAEQRGLMLEIDDVSLGLGAVTLSNLRVATKSGDTMRLELRRVRVVPNWKLGIASIEVHGGRLVLRGTATEIEAAAATWRRSRNDATPSVAPAASAPAVTIAGLDVVWRPSPESPLQRIWDLRLKTGDRRVDVRFGLARLELPGLGVDVRGGAASSRSGERPRAMERMDAAGMSAWIDLEHARPTKWVSFLFGASGDPEALPGRQLTDPQRGEVLHAGQLLRRQLKHAASALVPFIPSQGLALGGVEIELRNAGQRLKIGPAGLRVSRENGLLKAVLEPGPRAAAGMDLSIQLPLRDGPVDFRVAGGPVNLAALGVREGDFGLEEVRAARVKAETRARLAADGSWLRVDATGEVKDVTLRQPKLSHSALRDIDIGWSGRGSLSFSPRRLEVEAAQLSIGEVRLELAGSVERTEDYVVVDFGAKVPLAACQTMLESAPAGVFPALDGLKLAGTVSLDTAVAFDTRKPGEANVKWALDNRCRVTSVPASVDPRRFGGVFTYDVQAANGRWLEKTAGPGTNDWVPFGAISTYMETAILVCEDGRFYRHDGFDDYAIQGAIRQNIDAGTFLRGASTVTMQLAKNLYLGREKTLVRKVQEAVFTMLLEQQLTKEQILELYLNVIEYGPGLYGIGPAARFYFAKEPAQLSVAQAFYLASILPNPKAYHFDGDGRLKPGWQRYVRRLIEIAHERGRLTDSEVALALREELVFGRPGSNGDAGAIPALPTDLEPDPYEGGAGVGLRQQHEYVPRALPRRTQGALPSSQPLR